MDRNEFISKFKIASDIIYSKSIKSTLDMSDEYGLKNYAVRGHENLIIDMEELAELAQQISKCLRGIGDDDSKYSLIEEMADVRICLYHLQTLYAITDEELNKAINVKIDRIRYHLNDRIKNSRRE